MFKRLVACAIAMTVVVAACGGDEGAEAPGEGGGPSDVAAVLSELDGLDHSDRRARLVELVEQEGGDVTFYTSMSADNSAAVAAAFEEAYAVDVDLFRADSEAVTQRIREELAAGVQGADLVESSGLPLESLDPERFATYTSPYHDDLIDGAQNGHWVADQLDVFVLSWNTDAVSGDERPTAWEDLADPRWKGRLALEVDDVEWFAGLYRHWLEGGRSEAEVNALFQAIASNARFVKGHSLMAQLLASGEFDIAGSNFVNRLRQIQDEGAPVAFEPLVEPAIATLSGIGLLKSSRHPAAAVLFADWLLDDAQTLFGELHIVPARADLQPVGANDLALADVAALSKDVEGWIDRYAELAEGRDLIDDEG